MPRMSVCGILWNFGADDLVVPMVCNIAFKAFCSLLLGVLMYEVWHAGQFHGACTYSRVHVYVGGLLSVLFVGLWVSGVGVGWRGGGGYVRARVRVWNRAHTRASCLHAPLNEALTAHHRVP